MNNIRIIKNTINQKLAKKDRNGNNYLILKLDNEETIFVFAGKVKEEKWDWLKEGQEYSFTVEEGNNGSNILADYEIEVK